VSVDFLPYFITAMVQGMKPRLSEQISAIFFQNPAAWFLFVLLLIALHGSYQRGRELDQVCEAVAIPALIHVPARDYMEKAASICDERR
jgi:hypothetical protein